MKNTLSVPPIKANKPSSIDGVTIYEKPNFVVQRNMNRQVVCKDKSGKIIAEFNSIPSLTAYVSQSSGKSPNYVRQGVYKVLNKNEAFLGYFWTDK